MSALQLDWREYFYSFCDEHGPSAVYVENGRKMLLFADGWRYGMDYRGPEYPPPEDVAELLRLQREYWRLRAERFAVAVSKAKMNLAELRRLSSAKSLPLIHADKVTNPIEDAEQYLQSVQEKLDEANEKLQSL